MNFIYFIIIGVVIGIIFAIYQGVKNSKHKKESKNIFDSLDDFTASENYISETSGVSIGYDASRKKICLLNEKHETLIYNYKDILQSELDIDGETISKQSTTGTIGRAVLGGLIGGGAGAVVGALTGSKKQKQKVKKIDLKLSINDSKNPFYKINFLDIETKNDSIIYTSAYEKAERWQGIISTLIRQANELDNADEKSSSESTTDELLKLKSLLDSGVLTKEEFDIQKKKIIDKSN